MLKNIENTKVSKFGIYGSFRNGWMRNYRNVSGSNSHFFLFAKVGRTTKC